jgi:hypothetical protein
MGITGQRIAHMLSMFVGDAQEFIVSNQLLMAFLVLLAIAVFKMTRPQLNH